MIPALESMALPPILTEVTELGNCARLFAVASSAILADHRPGAVGGDADACQRLRNGHNAGAEQSAGSRIEAVEDLPDAAIGDAVDDGAVGIGGERGRNHLRGESVGIRRQGLRQGGEGGDGLHGPGDGVEEENPGRGDDEGAPIGNEGDAERRIAGGESLSRIVVEIDQRDQRSCSGRRAWYCRSAPPADTWSRETSRGLPVEAPRSSKCESSSPR